MKAISISLRLAIWYGAFSAVGLAILGTALWFVLAHSILSWKDRTLTTRAAHVQSLLDATSPTDAQTQYTRLRDLVRVLPEGELIQIVGIGGERLFPLAPAPSDLVIPDGHCAHPLIHDVGLGGDSFRVLCHPVTYAGKPAFLVIPSPLAEDRLLLRNFTFGLYMIVPLILLVSGLGGYALSRRALQPIDVLIAEANTITAKDLSRRLTVSAPDDQLRRLALEWNSLLGRIESAMLRMTQFTADASHELRTPIAFIRATAEYTLGSSALDPDARDAFRAIVEETRMTSRLLEDLLTLARLDDGVALGQVEPIHVQAVVSELATQFKPAMARKHQQLVLDWGDSPALFVSMQNLHFRRVITAVLDNAVKYTPENGAVHVTCEFAEKLQLSIRDTGIGIATDQIERVFDRFYRADQARSDMEGGVGLGLPIARWLMEMYGASIAIESQLHHGTTVTLSFPGSLLQSTL